MNTDTAYFGAAIYIGAKGLFAVGALIGVVIAAFRYRRMSFGRKVLFWAAFLLTMISLLGIATMAYVVLMNNRWVVEAYPQTVNFMVVGMLSVTFAAGATFSLFNRTETHQASPA